METISLYELNNKITTSGNQVISALSNLAKATNGGRIDLTSTSSSGTGTQLSWWGKYGNTIGLYNGSYWELVSPVSSPVFTYSGTVLNGTTTSGGINYDLYAEYVDLTSFNLVACAWASDTARSVTPTLFDGVYVYDTSAAGKKRRWLGTVRRRSTYNREWVNSETQRFISNFYNGQYGRGYKNSGSVNHTYTGTGRVWNNDITLTKVEFVLCQYATVYYSLEGYFAPPAAGYGGLNLKMDAATWLVSFDYGYYTRSYFTGIPNNVYTAPGYHYLWAFEWAESGASVVFDSAGCQFATLM
jgi:hypothetical protein